MGSDNGQPLKSGDDLWCSSLNLPCVLCVPCVHSLLSLGIGTEGCQSTGTGSSCVVVL